MQTQARIQNQGAKMAASGTKRKFNGHPTDGGWQRCGDTAYKAGTVQQKVGGALAEASSGKILGVGGGVAGAGAGGAAFGMNRKKP